ncbi:MAG: prepilin-type N-terminal cleavage/methylation domain-containing protein [Chitinispirillaceae bacterium]|nr:prepilin-type N-terminal cleavage/methylation domain-containing protein [Chitinispirillaceae bacterium]
MHKNAKGFTLVELLVAAAVISLSLFATVAMVRKGQEVIALDKHYRTAHGIVQRTLENPRYQPENYANLTAPANQSVPIDNTIQGTLSVVIGNEQALINGTSLPHRVITATVTWRELNSNQNETVSTSKWIADVQRE